MTFHYRPEDIRKIKLREMPTFVKRMDAQEQYKWDRLKAKCHYDKTISECNAEDTLKRINSFARQPYNSVMKDYRGNFTHGGLDDNYVKAANNQRSVLRFLKVFGEYFSEPELKEAIKKIESTE